METTVRTQHNVYDNLVRLRNKAASLAVQSEDEALLADIVAKVCVIPNVIHSLSVGTNMTKKYKRCFCIYEVPPLRGDNWIKN